MRLTTAPETILRSICRRLRAEGARMLVIVASETNGLAGGPWPANTHSPLPSAPRASPEPV